jgi:hypothetical protein
VDPGDLGRHVHPRPADPDRHGHPGRPEVGIRIEPTALLLFDLESRTLLRTRPNPLTAEQVLRLRGA